MSDLEVGPRFRPLLRGRDLVAETLEHRAQGHARDDVVFSNENVHERVRPGGFEPPTNSLEGCCSIHLSYGRPVCGSQNLISARCGASHAADPPADAAKTP